MYFLVYYRVSNMYGFVVKLEMNKYPIDNSLNCMYNYLSHTQFCRRIIWEMSIFFVTNLSKQRLIYAVKNIANRKNHF